jgi:poly-gamma-glutamate capsule biosynthesis protein CapA/YwtB (metallophosphatase superfamily)
MHTKIKLMPSNSQVDASSSISVFVSGDFCPAYVAEDVLLKSAAEKSILGDLFETIYNADFSITNLECPLTKSIKKIKKIGPNLKAPPGMASLLKDSGFNLITIANNHIYDYGQQGLSDTLDTLQRYGLSYVGAGLSLQEAQKPFYVEIKGIKLAIVNFTEVEFSSANLSHGGANPMDLIDNLRQIEIALNNADRVIVIVHGGHENYYYPSPETLKRYRFYAESGASVVIAHHTHCIGGFEQHKGVPIFYSLGNFIFPWHHKMSSSWHEGYAVLLQISANSLEFKLLPYEQCKNGNLSIEQTQSEAILKKIESLSLTLSDTKQISTYWEQFAKEQHHYYLAKMSGMGKYKTAIFSRLGLLKYFYQRTQLERVQQMISCEAHKELAYKILSDHLK